jgi:hypothetical protein
MSHFYLGTNFESGDSRGAGYDKTYGGDGGRTGGGGGYSNAGNKRVKFAADPNKNYCSMANGEVFEFKTNIGLPGVKFLSQPSSENKIQLENGAMMLVTSNAIITAGSPTLTKPRGGIAGGGRSGTSTSRSSVVLRGALGHISKPGFIPNNIGGSSLGSALGRSTAGFGGVFSAFSVLSIAKEYSDLMKEIKKAQVCTTVMPEA